MAKFHVVNASGGTFTNKDTGEKLEWGNAHILKDEKTQNNQFTGQVVSKVRATKEFFEMVKGKLPAVLDCNIDINSKGEVQLVGLLK